MDEWNEMSGVEITEDVIAKEGRGGDAVVAEPEPPTVVEVPDAEDGASLSVVDDLQAAGATSKSKPKWPSKRVVIALAALAAVGVVVASLGATGVGSRKNRGGGVVSSANDANSGFAEWCAEQLKTGGGDEEDDEGEGYDEDQEPSNPNGDELVRRELRGASSTNSKTATAGMTPETSSSISAKRVSCSI